MAIRTIAVFNASSRQGLAQLRALREQGYDAVAISRNPRLIAGEGLDGLRIVAADTADPVAVGRALDDVDAVFFQLPLLAGPDQLERAAETVAAAARRAGIARFIHNSTMWSPDDRCGEATYDHVRRIERIIESHDLPHTIFRPTLFMDNWLTAYALPLLRTQRLYRYPHKPTLRFSPIALDDLARFMVAALSAPQTIGRRYRVAGPETLTPPDVRAILSDAIGAEIAYEYQSPADFAAYTYDHFIHATGIPRDLYIAGFSAFYSFNNEADEQPFQFDVTPVLAELPIELESFAGWAARQDWSAGGRSASVTD